RVGSGARCGQRQRIADDVIGNRFVLTRRDVANVLEELGTTTDRLSMHAAAVIPAGDLAAVTHEKRATHNIFREREFAEGHCFGRPMAAVVVLEENERAL